MSALDVLEDLGITLGDVVDTDGTLQSVVLPIDSQAKTSLKGVNEQPHWRIVAYMLAAGAKVKEIAASLNIGCQSVRDIKNHDRTRKLTAQYIAEKGGDAIGNLFQSELARSVEVMVELRDNEKCPSTVRMACAKDLIDRGRGKPVTFAEVKHVEEFSDPNAEADRLRKLIEENQRKLAGGPRTETSAVRKE